MQCFDDQVSWCWWLIWESKTHEFLAQQRHFISRTIAWWIWLLLSMTSLVENRVAQQNVDFFPQTTWSTHADSWFSWRWPWKVKNQTWILKSISYILSLFDLKWFSVNNIKLGGNFYFNNSISSKINFLKQIPYALWLISYSTQVQSTKIYTLLTIPYCVF